MFDKRLIAFTTTTDDHHHSNHKHNNHKHSIIDTPDFRSLIYFIKVHTDFKPFDL
jgi:hypothetical protein